MSSSTKTDETYERYIDDMKLVAALLTSQYHAEGWQPSLRSLLQLTLRFYVDENQNYDEDDHEDDSEHAGEDSDENGSDQTDNQTHESVLDTCRRNLSQTAEKVSKLAEWGVKQGYLSEHFKVDHGQNAAQFVQEQYDRIERLRTEHRQVNSTADNQSIDDEVLSEIVPKTLLSALVHKDDEDQSSVYSLDPSILLE